ncbi:hypothetical protein [Gemmobacter sp. 24YEA27]|uniref:hypothetical protein n=1 Tax=Gemmobacter sp. 24YEA27 TaxID=3040672 RepID=UPI0024B3BDD2|nr:hypothetical protein [Gemmobacter sp. 24YEA27]
MQGEAKAILAQYGLELDVDHDLASYLVAICQIIAITRAASLSGKVLILEEPTASLDATEVRMVLDVVQSLRAGGLVILFVSHFPEQVFDLIDRVTVFRNGPYSTNEETARLNRVKLIAHMPGRTPEDKVLHSRPADRAPRPAMFRFQGNGRRSAVEPFARTVGKAEAREPGGQAQPDCAAARMRRGLVSHRKIARLMAQSQIFRPARTSWRASRRVTAGQVRSRTQNKPHRR